jgi:hypothetical protein
MQQTKQDDQALKQSQYLTFSDLHNAIEQPPQPISALLFDLIVADTGKQTRITFDLDLEAAE